MCHREGLDCAFVHPCAGVRREICVCDLSSPAAVGLSRNRGPIFRRIYSLVFSSLPPVLISSVELERLLFRHVIRGTRRGRDRRRRRALPHVAVPQHAARIHRA